MKSERSEMPGTAHNLARIEQMRRALMNNGIVRQGQEPESAIASTGKQMTHRDSYLTDAYRYNPTAH
jgi:hypothetical protein